MIQNKIAMATIALISATITACNNPLEVETSDKADQKFEEYFKSNSLEYTHSNGVYQVVTSSSYAYEVNNGDTVSFWYTGKVFNSKLIFDTNIKSVAIDNNLDTTVRNLGLRTVVIDQEAMLEGLRNGILLCRQGQQSSIYINPSYGYGDTWNGIVEPWSSLVFDIEITHVNNPSIVAEKAAIAAMNLNSYTLHESGLYYKFENDTTGALAQATDTVYAWYQCTLPNGTAVEDVAQANTAIAISDKNITSALRVGLQLLSAGRKVSIVAPSPLGYGKNGTKTVEPYQTLLYEVRLDSIR